MSGAAGAGAGAAGPVSAAAGAATDPDPDADPDPGPDPGPAPAGDGDGAGGVDRTGTAGEDDCPAAAVFEGAASEPPPTQVVNPSSTAIRAAPSAALRRQ